MELPTLPPSFATAPTPIPAPPAIEPSIISAAIPPAASSVVDDEADARGPLPVSTPTSRRVNEEPANSEHAEPASKNLSEAESAEDRATPPTLTEAPAPVAAAPNIWATQAAKAQARNTGNLGKRGRASMPSWDEIVFGARSDDDLA